MDEQVANEASWVGVLGAVPWRSCSFEWTEDTEKYKILSSPSKLLGGKVHSLREQRIFGGRMKFPPFSRFYRTWLNWSYPNLDRTLIFDRLSLPAGILTYSWFFLVTELTEESRLLFWYALSAWSSLASSLSILSNGLTCQHNFNYWKELQYRKVKMGWTANHWA